jgi:hypothetical protein
MNATQITTRHGQAPTPWDIDGGPDDWAEFPDRGGAHSRGPS